MSTKLKNRPLDGVRVLDFTWSVAGPTMTRYLASLGAEIIKVEWPMHPDPMRSAMYLRDESDKTLNNGSFFANLNIGKRSLSLNARDPHGLDVIRELVAKCDVVAESFSPGVLEKWGMGFEAMQAINPGIVYVSISGFGHTGPHRNKGTWGPTAQAMGGTTFMSGMPGNQPAGWGWSYLDVSSGYFGAIGVLSALFDRKRTGKGVRLDLSQVEVGVSLLGPGMLEHAVTGRSFVGQQAVPGGNRSLDNGGATVGYRGDSAAPHGVYRTAGEGANAYCAISVLDDAQWQRLKEAMGQPAWAADAALDTVGGRVARQDELDAHLAQWAATQDKYALMQQLQAHGVAASAVQSPHDLVEHDPQLRARGLHVPLEHPRLGKQLFESVPFRMEKTELALEPHWPLLGQDTDYVLREVLGYSEAQIESLAAAHITWPEGLPVEPKVERSLW